jgi:hypothetical protein
MGDDRMTGEQSHRAEAGGGEQEDAALVQLARDGDRAAFATLLGRHWELLLALCRRALDDPELARDAAQEAALQAMLGLDRLRQATSFGPWLGGIGRRSRRGRSTRPRSQRGFGSIGSRSAGSRRPSSEASPSSRFAGTRPCRPSARLPSRAVRAPIFPGVPGRVLSLSNPQPLRLVVAAVPDCPIRLDVAVCDGNTPAVTINEGNDRTHRTQLKARQANRCARSHAGRELAPFDLFEDLRLVEQGTDHPEADPLAKWSLRGRRHGDTCT